ncbi:MAG: hypothetical protein D6692_00310 [Planctomycetota bacterium]|nr:MAG: hypothetical protein D6692_00310 [Planctomycetota bacterium]
MRTNPARDRIAPLIASACLVLSGAAEASPTGLNNIPTADTPGHRQFVLQFSYTSNYDAGHDTVGAFKSGLDLSRFVFVPLRFEFGVDGRLGDEGAGPTAGQVKIAADLPAPGPALAFGVSNIAFTDADREDAGQLNPYVVVSQDLELLRLHAGYAFAADNQAAFFGLDRTFKLGETRFTPRFDITQIQDQAQWMGSAGFIWGLTKHVALEAWVSQPFDDGQTTFTLKINLGFTF